MVLAESPISQGSLNRGPRAEASEEPPTVVGVEGPRAAEIRLAEESAKTQTSRTKVGKASLYGVHPQDAFSGGLGPLPSPFWHSVAALCHSHDSLFSRG